MGDRAREPEASARDGVSAVRVVPVASGREMVSRRILAALPQWFGIPSAREAYVHHSAAAPMLGAEVGDQIIGYIALAGHFGINCEIHSMGVEPAWHRRGIGRALVEAAACRAGEEGFRYLTVKTLSEAHPDPNYAGTRQFYLAMGFEPFEEMPELWGADLPCLVLVRALRR